MISAGFVFIIFIIFIVQFSTSTDPCTNTSGLLNSGTCQCGSETCTNSTGLICYSTTGGGSCRPNDEGAYGYPRPTSGNCVDVSVSGRGLIGDIASCNAAASSLGLRDTTASESRYTGYPPGCFWNNNNLKFNTLSTSTTSCASSSEYCICIAGSVCDHENGTNENSGRCICGNIVCGYETAGLYCTASENKCHKTPVCAHTEGSLTNANECSCGNTECTSATGLFCYSPHNICADYANPRKIGAFTAPKCPQSDGVNTSPCVCGDSGTCTGSGADNTGLVCDAETSTCSRPDSCSKTDGLVKNAASCACGSVDCASEEYCRVRLNGCSQYAHCSVTNGSNATGGTCACGSVDCAVEEYCHYGTEDWLTQWGLCRNSSDIC